MFPYGLVSEYITSGKRLRGSKHPPKEGRAAKDTDITSSPIKRPAIRREKRAQNVCDMARSFSRGNTGTSRSGQREKEGECGGGPAKIKICMKMPSEPITLRTDFFKKYFYIYLPMYVYADTHMYHSTYVEVLLPCGFWDSN